MVSLEVADDLGLSVPTVAFENGEMADLGTPHVIPEPQLTTHNNICLNTG